MSEQPLQIRKDTNGSTFLGKYAIIEKYYQTFDEFTMSGKGQAKRSPFVFVKRWNDSILVYSSNKNDSTRLYIKQNSNIWYSHMEYDMWKKQDYILPKDGLSKPARTYDRYFLNDTIIELETMFICGQQDQRLYIKSRKDLYIINNVKNIKCSSDFSEIHRIVNSLLSPKKGKILQYSLKESNDKYIYEGKMERDNYSYEKKAYGFWGIQPGVGETFLYKGIDVREYSDNLDGFQRNNPNKVYEVVDEMPTFPTGFSGLQDYIRKNRATSLMINDVKPYRVVLEVVIEQDGSITNAKIARSINSLYDEDALRIVGEMPKWIPAKQNGKTVRCKMLIPISYNEEPQ